MGLVRAPQCPLLGVSQTGKARGFLAEKMGQSESAVPSRAACRGTESWFQNRAFLG